MRRPVKRHWSLLLTVWFLGACSSEAPSPRRQGTVTMKASAPETVDIVAATYLLVDHDGETIEFDQLTPDLATVSFTLEQAPDYLVSVNALARDEADGRHVECEGFRSFDVFREEEVRVDVPLQCKDLWPRTELADAGVEEPCWLQSIVVAPLEQWVTGLIHASVTVFPAKAQLEWSVSDAEIGDFENRASEGEVAFHCASAGTTTLSVRVSNGRCSDQAKVEITCYSPEDAGTGNGSEERRRRMQRQAIPR